jgi:dienelactone hydrolase
MMIRRIVPGPFRTPDDRLRSVRLRSCRLQSSWRSSLLSACLLNLCLLTLWLLPASVTAQAAQARMPTVPADEWLRQPVSDATYRSYLDFFRYDADLALDVQVASRQDRDGVTRERLSFASTPGTRVTATFGRPSAAGWQQRPTVLLLHGGVAGGKESVGAILDFLVRAGMNVLAIDMLHFGERRTGLLTTFSEEEKHDRLYNHQSTYLTWVVQTVKDAGRSVDVLTRHYGVDPGRIGLVGYSRGATVGTIIGAVDERLRAVLLLLGTHFDALETGHLAAACPANYIGRISPRPLLMVNGNYDSDHVKETQVEPLFRLARAPKRIIWQEAGHQVLPEHRDDAIDWLRQQLR